MFVVFSQRLDDEVGRERGLVIVERSFPQERYYKLVTDYATFQQRCRAFFAPVFTPLFFLLSRIEPGHRQVCPFCRNRSNDQNSRLFSFYCARLVGSFLSFVCRERERERGGRENYVNLRILLRIFNGTILR